MAEEKKWKLRILDSLFPTQYDFHEMLQTQAEMTKDGVHELVKWLHKKELSEPEALRKAEQAADDHRHAMEDKLIEAFSTPYDRQDIYQISRQMDYILNYSLSTALEMVAFKVHCDRAIHEMAEALQEGTALLAEAIRLMEKDRLRADAMIEKMRAPEHRIEEAYINHMSILLDTSDPVMVMKKREIYHHLKDAGRTMSVTIDILHRFIVGIP